jgi:hypothetical protein
MVSCSSCDGVVKAVTRLAVREVLIYISLNSFADFMYTAQIGGFPASDRNISGLYSVPLK